MLFSHGFRYRKDKTGQELKFSFEKPITIGPDEHVICVDLVGPEYGGKSKKGFREKVQTGVHVHKARGIDLVFNNPVNVAVTAILQDGIKHTENVLVVNGATYIIVKTITFESRKEPKDAYDIYYCLKNYPGGLAALIEEYQKIKNNGLVKEGIVILNKLFTDPLAIGPQRAARFMADNPTERTVIATECAKLITTVLKT